MIEYRYMDFPPESLGTATISSEEVLQGNIEDVIIGIPAYNYSSFEEDTFFPSNPRKFVNENPLGFVTERISNENGVFEVPIKITIDFNSLISMTGISLNTSLSIEDCEIILNDINKQTHSQKYGAQTDNFFAFENGEDISKIEIKINKINKPHHFFKLFSILFGKVRYFSNEVKTGNIKSQKIIKSFSLSGRELPIDTLDIEFTNNEDTEYLFQKRQLVEVWKKDDEQNTEEKIANFYVESGSANNENSLIKMSCLDIVENLETQYLGGMWQSATVGEVVEDILKGTGISCVMSDKVRNTKVWGYIPIETRRNALVYVANATGYKFLKQPELSLIELPTNISAEFDENNVFMGNTKDSQQETKELILYKFSYTPNEEILEAFNSELNVGEALITFNEPLHSCKIYHIDGTGNKTEADDSLAIINDLGVNYIKLNIIKSAAYIIEGKKYTVNKIAETRSNVAINQSKDYKTEIIETFTLTSDNNVIDSLFDYYKKINTYKEKVIIGDADIGQKVRVNGKEGHIVSLSTNLTETANIEVQ